MDFTSRHGQPARPERWDVCAGRSAPSIVPVKTVVHGGIVCTAKPYAICPRATIVTFVTYAAEGATAQRQHLGDSNLADIPQQVAGFALRAAYVRSFTLWAFTRRPRTGYGWSTGATASGTMTYWPARAGSCLARVTRNCPYPPCSCSIVSTRSRK